VRLLGKILTSPVTGPLDTALFVARRINDQVAEEYLDEGKVQADLLDLTMRYEHGELDDAAFEEQQEAILDHLNDIRAYKEEAAAADAEEDVDEEIEEPEDAEEPGAAESEE
jgi:hypothetical protein